MRRVKLYLPYAAWPEEDRTLWEAVFKPGNDLFEDQGPAAHLAERTRLALQYAYSKFLAFLSARHGTLLGRAPAERLNRKIIEDYVKWQPATCGGITLAIYLNHLWLTLLYICPDEDWSWLLIISKRIAAQAKLKPKKHNLVTSDTLYALGIELMDRVISYGRPADDQDNAKCLSRRSDHCAARTHSLASAHSGGAAHRKTSCTIWRLSGC